MLDRRPTSDPEVVEVTFRLPVEVGAQVVHVVGDFNEWSRDATPLERDGDRFSVTLELRAGSTYQFRYLLDGHVWENDWAADDYVGNEFGGENSLLDLTDGSSRNGGAPAGGPHAVGAIDEPELAAVEEALAVDSLATDAQTVSAAASVLTPVAEGGLAAPPADEPTARSGSADAPSKSTKGSGSAKAKGSTSSKDSAKGTTKKAKGKGTASSKSSPKSTASSKRADSSKRSSGGGKGSSKDRSTSSSSPTKAELLEAAKELDISGRSKMNKDELERAVAAARRS